MTKVKCRMTKEIRNPNDETGPVRRRSPDPAEMIDRRSPEYPETFGQAVWLGPPLIAAVPETGHNKSLCTSTLVIFTRQLVTGGFLVVANQQHSS
jgi:hypothetical protein